MVETTLIVYPNSFAIDSLTLCTNDSILLQGSYQTSAGVYLDTVQSQFGCDSILITYLDFDTVVYSNRVETICAGDSIQIGNVYYHVSGNYTNTLISQGGCDSIESVELIVLPQIVFIDTVSICNLDSIFLEGSYQNTSGNYFDTLQTLTGCDSVIETILSVDSIIYGYEDISICYGDSIFISGNYENQDGIYYDTVTSNAGCDSITTYNLSVNPLIQVVDGQQICTNDSIFLQGAYQFTTGTYVDTLNSVAGCDSIVTTYLVVDNILYGNDTVSICFGDSILLVVQCNQ